MKPCRGDGMVDIGDLKSPDGNVVRVRVPPSALQIRSLTRLHIFAIIQIPYNRVQCHPKGVFVKDFNNTGRVYGNEETPEREGLRKLLTTVVVFFLGLMVVCGLLGGCSQSASGGTPLTPEQRYVQEQAAWKQRQGKVADQVAERMLYFRDLRTGLCFSYFWEERHNGSTYSGGPALATVPCESIPASMLATSSTPPPR